MLLLGYGEECYSESGNICEPLETLVSVILVFFLLFFYWCIIIIVSIILDTYPEVGLLNEMVVLSLVLWGTATLFSKMKFLTPLFILQIPSVPPAEKSVLSYLCLYSRVTLCVLHTHFPSAKVTCSLWFTHNLYHHMLTLEALQYSLIFYTSILRMCKFTVWNSFPLW